MTNRPSERIRGVKNNFYWIEILIYGNKIMLDLNKNYFAKTNLPWDYLLRLWIVLSNQFARKVMIDFKLNLQYLK